MTPAPPARHLLRAKDLIDAPENDDAEAAHPRERWVHDQDEALAFYTDTLGMELRDDATLAEIGNFRWLTVGPPSQPDVAFALMAIPGPPVLDADTADKLKELVAKGAAGVLFFSTDDCKSTYQDLKGRGVEITQEPTERPYGIDAAFRDPSGNQIRMVQM